MIVMDQFISYYVSGREIKEYKPKTSMIAGKLAEDYQQARKTAEDDQGRSKGEPPEGGKHCLVCCKIGYLARECPNKVHKLSIKSSSTPQHN